MTKEECYNAPKCAGIYLIENTSNGKKYIGQAVKLKKRLLSHLSNFDKDYCDTIVLYKAFKKYGLESFNLKILDTFSEALSQTTKNRLNELEKYYIKQYNSLIPNGYNMTLGGDGGVLGYRHSGETKNIIREGVKKHNEQLGYDPTNWIKARSIKTGYTIIAINITTLAENNNFSRVAISRCLSGKQKLLNKEYLVARYLDDFPEYSADEKELTKKRNSIKEKVKEILDIDPNISSYKVEAEYDIKKSTFLRYRKLLGRVPETRTDTKVSRREFITYQTSHTKEECCNHFDISERRYYKYLHKYK